jgi:hypothetical protein
LRNGQKAILCRLDPLKPPLVDEFVVALGPPEDETESWCAIAA